MTLEISDSILQNSRMTESELRLELAIVLFEKNRLTYGQAADLAEMDIEDFEKILIELKLLYPYTRKPHQRLPLTLNGEKFPKNLEDFAIQPKQLNALVQLFENQPSAEELCKML